MYFLSVIISSMVYFNPDFKADCVVERLKSSQMKPCYDGVLNDSVTALNSSDLHYDVCQ